MQNIYQLLSFNKEVYSKRLTYPLFRSISYHQQIHLYLFYKQPAYSPDI